MLLNEICEIDDGTGINQLTELTFRINQFRVIAACGHQGDFILSSAAADIKFGVKRDAGLGRNDFAHIILHVIPVWIGIGTKK
ncbi:hypothetical protein D3C74_308450 [compost metagenome]